MYELSTNNLNRINLPLLMSDFSKKPKYSENTIFIKGTFDKYKDWNMDPKGYFLVRIKKDENCIELGFCKENNVIDVVISGKVPQEIYMTAVKKGLLSKAEHAAYLGKELEKAYLALKYNLKYVQDDELEIK